MPTPLPTVLRALSTLAFAALALCVGASPRAAVVTFTDTRTTAPVTAGIADFSRDPSIEPGVCWGTSTNAADCIAVGDALFGIWGYAGPHVSPVPSLAFLTDPGTSAVTAVISLRWGTDGPLAYMTSYFQSDPADYPTVPAGYFSLPDTGGLIDVSHLFSTGNGIALAAPPGLSIRVQTPAAEAIPAPASALVLASALALAVAARKRQPPGQDPSD